MGTCRFQRKAERWFDGESNNRHEVERHVAECPDCAAWLEMLRETRAGVESVLGQVEISDAQLPAFLEGIREQIQGPRRRARTGLWALASVTAAALVVAISMMTIFSDGPAPVQAQTIVEQCSTELDGATTTSYYSEDGTATVWVNVPEGDMW